MLQSVLRSNESLSQHIELYLMKHFAKVLCIFIISACLTTTLKAADIHDFQSWFGLTVVGRLKSENQFFSKVRYEFLAQERNADDSTRFFQSLLRTGAGYQLTNHSSVWLGYDWLHTDDVFAPYATDTNSPWQQFMWENSYEYFSFMSRTRLEEQFVEGNSDVGWRVRQMIQFIIPIRYVPDLSVLTFDELFVNINGISGIDDPGTIQNRIFLGLSYGVSEHVLTQLGYMNQFIENFETDSFLNNILFFGVVLRFN